MPRPFASPWLSLMMKEQEIRQGWERFIEDGTISKALRGVVVASWQRSQSHGIPVERNEAPLAPEAELMQRRSAHAALLEAARPALNQVCLFLGEANSMIILTDSSGLVLETAGDPRTIDFGQQIHLEQGGSWKEADIGTNAIGTAIAESRPVQIHGLEHFCSDVKRWTCAATPIWHPTDGELLGVIDISGPVRTFNPQSLALAVALGRQIEGTLAQSIEYDHERLLRYFMMKRSRWANVDVLAIDQHGKIVFGPECVLQNLEREQPGLISNGCVSSLKNVRPTAWSVRLNELLPNTSTELVVDHGRQLGAILVLQKERRRSAWISPQVMTERLFDFEEILGESAVMQKTRERARKMAMAAAPILIEGETGVGKELFARAIYGASQAACGPFVPVNCGGMPRDLVGSEIFGYAKGAFTGAKEQGHAGKIEAADGGVLCLDEIGEMPLDLQPYLLRVLEDGVVYRIGSNEGRAVRIRLVAMTHRDLLAEVNAGRFRRDLYYRIASMRVLIPPLRDRGDDVVLLAHHFAGLAAASLDRPVPRFDDKVLDLFRAYSWPGNVRELRNVIENMILLGDSSELQIEDVPMEVHRQVDSPVAALALEQSSSASPHLKQNERAVIESALAKTGGKLTAAAKLLGIARATLYRKLAHYGIVRSSRD
jgi:sigma-54 dependent transcriptional regulator, acetoin dehydrogenase operon transcriptional activator AcoR